MCLVLLAQMAFPVWAEDDPEIEIGQIVPSQNARNALEDEELTVEAAGVPIVDEMDEIVLDNTLDVDLDLTDLNEAVLMDEAGEGPEGTEYTSNAADDFEIINGVLVEYRGNGGAVTIPEGVTAIADEAFEDCDNLTSITISSGVKI
jgi:hypothetical protein